MTLKREITVEIKNMEKYKYKIPYLSRFFTFFCRKKQKVSSSYGNVNALSFFHSLLQKIMEKKRNNGMKKVK